MTIDEIDNIKKNKKIELPDILNALDFVYHLREKFLADDAFVRVNLEKLTSIDFLIKGFFAYKANKKSFLAEEILNSTSHFSVVDKFNNVVSVTSSIESTFGSRVFVKGFFLNNQLTDFSFKSINKNNPLSGGPPRPPETQVRRERNQLVLGASGSVGHERISEARADQ